MSHTILGAIKALVAIATEAFVNGDENKYRECMAEIELLASIPKGGE